MSGAATRFDNGLRYRHAEHPRGRMTDPREGVREPYDESEIAERGTPFMLASRPPKTEPGSSAADVDGAESPSGSRGHHESVGERQGRQPGSDSAATIRCPSCGPKCGAIEVYRVT